MHGHAIRRAAEHRPREGRSMGEPARRRSPMTTGPRGAIVQQGAVFYVGVVVQPIPSTRKAGAPLL